MHLIVLSCLLVALFRVSDIRADDCSTDDFSCWQEKTEQGDASAQYNLGVTYSKGQGVMQNYAQAHKFYNMAAAQLTGERRETAAQARDELAQKMTLQQIAKAQRLVSEWKLTPI